MIKANKQLEAVLARKPKKCDRNERQHWINQSSQQEKKTRLTHFKLTILDNITVKISEHNNLNQRKGTMHCKNHPGYSDEDISNE